MVIHTVFFQSHLPHAALKVNASAVLRGEDARALHYVLGAHVTKLDLRSVRLAGHLIYSKKREHT